jgi:hypothetical protein
MISVVMSRNSPKANLKGVLSFTCRGNAVIAVISIAYSFILDVVSVPESDRQTFKKYEATVASLATEFKSKSHFANLFVLRHMHNGCTC